MRRLTSVKQYGLIEGALLALAPFALLMAHNKAGQFPALMPPLAAFFTAGCGLADSDRQSVCGTAFCHILHYLRLCPD